MSRLDFDSESYEKHSVIENDVFLTELIHAPVAAKVAFYTNRDSVLSKLSVENLCILSGGRVIITMQLWTKVLTEIYDNHPEIVKMKKLACSYVWWPSMNKNRKHFKILH